MSARCWPGSSAASASTAPPASSRATSSRSIRARKWRARCSGRRAGGSRVGRAHRAGTRGAAPSGRRLAEGQAPRPEGSQGKGAREVRGRGGRGRPPGRLAARHARRRLRLSRRQARQHRRVQGAGLHRGHGRGPGARHVRGDSLMQGKRLDRVNQLVKEEISMLLQRELKDPRLGFVSITEVEPARDMRTAKVFVLMLGHVHPDADVLGTLLALGLALESRGWSVTYGGPHPAPPLLAFLPGVDRYRPLRTLDGTFDLVVLTDCPNPDRTEGLIDQARRAGKVIVNVDHHPDNRRYGHVNWIDSTAAATGEMVY